MAALLASVHESVQGIERANQSHGEHHHRHHGEHHHRHHGEHHHHHHGEHHHRHHGEHHHQHHGEHQHGEQAQHSSKEESRPLPVTSGSQRPDADDLGAMPIVPAPSPENPPLLEPVEEEEKMVYTFRQHLYLLLEDPDSSFVARACSHFILYTIVTSIACFVLETVPDFKGWGVVWNVVEPVTTIIFSIEYVGRLFVCDAFPPEYSYHQTKCNFIKSPMNILDLLAILPFYLEVAAEELMKTVKPLRVLRSVRLIRCFRIFKLSKYSLGMTVMVESLLNSVQPLSILTFFLFIGVVLTSSLMYFAERVGCPDVKHMIEIGTFPKYQDECDASDNGRAPNGDLCCNRHGAALDFESIYRTFWWSMVTMTTVGYGDTVPRTFPGRLVGGLAMLSGIVLISLPVAIVGSKFQQAYDLLEEDKKKFPTLEEQQREKGINQMLKQREDEAQQNAEAAAVLAEVVNREQKEEKGEEMAITSVATSGTGTAQPDLIALRNEKEYTDAKQRISSLTAKLKSIEERPDKLSEKARDEVSLLLEMLDHIERVEKQLKINRDKDTQLDAAIRKEFVALSRTYSQTTAG